MTDNSPCKITTGGITAFVTVKTGTVEAVRKLLRNRLKEDGRVILNPEMVTQRLRLESVDEAFVNACKTACLKECHEQLQTLESLALEADRKRGSSVPETGGKKAKRREKKMYSPLNDLFKFVGTYRHISQDVDVRGTCHCDAEKAIKGEEHTTGFPRIFPDGVALAHGCDHGSFYWRNIRAFVECKASTSQGEPSRSDTVPETVVQGADYARLHLSADPFRVFSVGLLIYGFTFMVGIYDQDGVCLSAPYHLRDNLDVFIRVVYQLGHGLTDTELGRDPTVEELHLPQDAPLRLTLNDIVNEHIRSVNSRNFPSYKITLKTGDTYSMEGGEKQIETETTTWVTIGPPLWSSLSFLGRGSAVWRVVALEDDQIPRPREVLILKNAWRRNQRDSESRIYAALRHAEKGDKNFAYRKGIADFKLGADVTFPGRVEVISTNNLRFLFLKDFAIHPPAPQTPILHRLILETQGKPLWHFESFNKLLLGMRAALEGHKYLVSQGILHRDISAGNIMLSLSDNPRPGMEGFLMDLEFARVDTIAETYKMKAAPEKAGATQTIFTDAKRGAEITGTLQFMAAELLTAIKQGQWLKHEAHHDLESFIWVLTYVICRHLNERSGITKEQREGLKTHFTESFGLYSVQAIRVARLSLQPFELPIYEGLMPIPIQTLLGNLREAIQTGNAGLVSVQATTAEAVRVLLRDRLREDGKVTRVPQLVAQRLRLDSVDESFVRSCRDACIVEGAKSLDELETLAAKADLLKGMCRQRDKKKMYPALNWLFEFITCYRHDSQTITARGSCRCSTKMGIKGEEHTAGFPRTFPDGVALAKGCTPDSLYWRDVRAFVGCKASPLQGEPSRATTIPETVVQGADYARLHLSADPFRVFSVGLLIYGFRFMVAIYDQDGVCISDSYHLRNNLDVFIRVIYQLGHGLSDVELGRDPTVEQLHLPEGSQLRKALDDLAEKQGMPTVSKDFPSYKITLKTSDIYSMDGATKFPETGEATWVTIGPPIWSSLSYLGRGTTVWRVVAIDGSDIPRPNEVLILKNAWRRSHRDSESSIYVTLSRAIGDDPLGTHRKGIAEFWTGTDVTFPRRSEAISVNNLRYLFLDGSIIPTPAPQTPVLHRLILATQGRALWYCKNLKELLRGMGAALRGHKFLVSKGILHRDISAGNIMLSSLANPPDGMEGFLVDLEYARLNTIPDIHAVEVVSDATTSATHTVFGDAKRGAEMTGTLQFMAAELLEGLEKGKSVRHEVHHDLESFVWVLAYAVSRHLQRRSGLGEAVKAELRQHFVRSYGRFLFADITDARISLRPLRPPPAYEEMLPQGMNDLYVGLQTALNAHFVHIRGREPKPLTHDILLDLFDTTHHSL
ncbi:hypothetical protein EYR38_005242 [Pleurotus pulmonarius]|nr:hypothetical protein EYR38_005242 [Pleurotus pulmonarius]